MIRLSPACTRCEQSPDGDKLTYSWSIIDKPLPSKSSLSNPALVNPTFVPDRIGTYKLQLVVNDGTVDSDPEEVAITVKPTTMTVTGDIKNLQTIINGLDIANFKNKNSQTHPLRTSSSP